VTMTCLKLCPPIKEYSLAPHLFIRPHLVGTGERTFPGISFTAKVNRHPFYNVVFAAIPMGLFALLSVLTAGSRRIENLNHRAHLSMILVLTAAAYRIASSRGLPPINYLTMLDRYNLGNGGLVICCAILSRVQQLRFGELPEWQLQAVGLPQSDFTGIADLVCTCLFAAWWVVMHVWFAILAKRRLVSPRIFDESLRDPDNKLCDNTVIPPLRASGTITRRLVKSVKSSPVGWSRAMSRARRDTNERFERET